MIFIGLFFISAHTPPFDFRNSGIKTVVIDAGHGGKDPGAISHDVWESKITLAIALEVEKKLKQELPDLKVILTRDDDTFVELHNRAKHASDNEADFFISIHCNSNPNDQAHGTETYIMGPHMDNANLSTIMRENEAILLEDNQEEEYDGFDPKDPSSYIVFTILQNSFHRQSKNLALKIEENFAGTGRKSRGVKQAGYLVLWKAATPSILIETGFLTNGDEAKFLNSEIGRANLAEDIVMAVKTYSKEMTE